MVEDTKNLSLILVVCCVNKGLKDGLHSIVLFCVIGIAFSLVRGRSAMIQLFDFPKRPSTPPNAVNQHCTYSLESNSFPLFEIIRVTCSKLDIEKCTSNIHSRSMLRCREKIFCIFFLWDQTYGVKLCIVTSNNFFISCQEVFINFIHHYFWLIIIFKKVFFFLFFLFTGLKSKIFLKGIKASTIQIKNLLIKYLFLCFKLFIQVSINNLCALGIINLLLTY